MEISATYTHNVDVDLQKDFSDTGLCNRSVQQWLKSVMAQFTVVKINK